MPSIGSVHHDLQGKASMIDNAKPMKSALQGWARAGSGH